MNITIADIKLKSAGAEQSMLERAGVPAGLFKGGHYPCLFCGGTDRAWWNKRGKHAGTYGCRQCGNHDFLDLLNCVQNCTMHETLNWLKDQLGLRSMNMEDKALYTKQRKEFERLQVERERKLAEKAKAEMIQAAIRANKEWSQGIAVDLHPYLIKKKCKPFNIRQHGSVLLIPVYGPNRKIYNLQKIYADGKKLFLKNGKKQGCFFVIGRITSDTKKVLFTEGFATGSSLHDKYKTPVVITFDCGNLLPAANSFRSIYPDMEIIFCADNDMLKVSGAGERRIVNPGIHHARHAAKTIGNSSLLIPAFDPVLWGKYSDFNDLFVSEKGELRYKKWYNNQEGIKEIIAYKSDEIVTDFYKEVEVAA